MKTKTIIKFLYVIAFLIRVWLYGMGFYDILVERVEISTPLTSFNRLQEGRFLKQIGLSPYEGSTFHQPPIILHFLSVPSLLSPISSFLFILFDLLIANVLKNIASSFLQHEEGKLDRTSPPSPHFPDIVALLYLLLPFSITTCIGKSVGIIDSIFILYSLYYAINGNAIFSMVCLSVAVYTSIYPIQLIFPLLILLKKTDRRVSVILFLISLGCLLLASKEIEGSWSFLNACYYFVLRVVDLTPNIGLFWYFFSEVFEHFYTFFCCVLQLNCFLYAVPLTICLYDKPYLLFWSIYTLQAVLKPYPSMSDLTLQFGLLPLFSPLLVQFTMRTLIIFQIFLYVLFALMPMTWYLWIYQGSGNANFYYGMTLGLGFAQVWLLIEMLHYSLENSYKRKHKIAPFDDPKSNIVDTVNQEVVEGGENKKIQ